jgi:hypothetical protein
MNQGNARMANKLLAIHMGKKPKTKVGVSRRNIDNVSKAFADFEVDRCLTEEYE